MRLQSMSNMSSISLDDVTSNTNTQSDLFLDMFPGFEVSSMDHDRKQAWICYWSQLRVFYLCQKMDTNQNSLRNLTVFLLYTWGSLPELLNGYTWLAVNAYLTTSIH